DSGSSSRRRRCGCVVADALRTSMIAHAHELQYLISSGRTPAGAADPFLTRIANALDAVNRDGDLVGPSDIAGLLRQAMLRHHIRYHDVTQLRVPETIGWPGPDIWQLFGCDTSRAGVDHLFVRPRAWTPQWLGAGATE